MSNEDVIKLNDIEQIKAIWKATYVGCRKNTEHRILLYQLDAFFVEVFYHKELKLIRHILPFKTKRQLAPIYKICLN
jgi:hypothetical protein